MTEQVPDLVGTADERMAQLERIAADGPLSAEWLRRQLDALGEEVAGPHVERLVLRRVRAAADPRMELGCVRGGRMDGVGHGGARRSGEWLRSRLVNGAKYTGSVQGTYVEAADRAVRGEGSV